MPSLARAAAASIAGAFVLRQPAAGQSRQARQHAARMAFLKTGTLETYPDGVDCFPNGITLTFHPLAIGFDSASLCAPGITGIVASLQRDCFYEGCSTQA